MVQGKQPVESSTVDQDQITFECSVSSHEYLERVQKGSEMVEQWAVKTIVVAEFWI